MAHTALARGDENRSEGIQALEPNTTQSETSIGASGTVWFLAVAEASGVADASSGKRMALAPDTGHYIKVPPLGLVAVWDGSAGGAFANAVQAGVTVVWVYYDSTAGTAYMTEMT